MINGLYYYADAKAWEKKFVIVTNGEKVMGIFSSLEELVLTAAEKELQLVQPKKAGDSYFGDPGDFVANGVYYSNGTKFAGRVSNRNSHLWGERELVISSPGEYKIRMEGEYRWDDPRETLIVFQSGRLNSEFSFEGQTVMKVTVEDIVKVGHKVPERYLNNLEGKGRVVCQKTD
jgi:hypothetical protein